MVYECIFSELNNLLDINIEPKNGLGNHCFLKKLRMIKSTKLNKQRNRCLVLFSLKSLCRLHWVLYLFCFVCLFICVYVCACTQMPMLTHMYSPEEYTSGLFDCSLLISGNLPVPTIRAQPCPAGGPGDPGSGPCTLISLAPENYF